MRLFRRRGPAGPAAARGSSAGAGTNAGSGHPAGERTDRAGPFSPCSQCGRTQFPLVGDWDPPICADCDAAINEDAMWSEEAGR